MDKLIIKPNKYGSSSSVVSARLPDEMIEKLESLSKQTGKSRNELLVSMIDFAIENTEIQKQ